MPMKHYAYGFVLTKGVLLTGLCAGLFGYVFSWNKLMIARDGQTRYTIVQADRPTGPEKMALQELTNFLSRVTGASFPVAAESAVSGKVRGIYVGWTRYAAQNGIDAVKLGEEEWIIRSVGKNIIITGGRPRGTLYAVYEFLEQEVGCHWLDRNTEIIPSKPTLALDKLNIQGKPAMWLRDMTWSVLYGVFPTADMMERRNVFLGRNKSSFSDGPPWLTGGVYRVVGSPGGCHTFSDYLNATNWSASHPEYFSMNGKGQREPARDGNGPGQLCLSNPDVRRIVLEQLRKFIAADRAKAAQRDCPPPWLYDISQNDNGHMCKCANCQAIIAREGGEGSGLMIDFINAVAEGIEKDYPDVFVQTFAYDDTRKAPANLKPRHNVIMRWCDKYGISDMGRPLNHPYNAETYREILGWGKIAPHLSVWDYWYAPSAEYFFPAPFCMIQCIGPDLRLFAEMHVKALYCESSDEALLTGETKGMKALRHGLGVNFADLRYWLGYKLMDNPSRPAAPLIRTFMQGYYGAAAPQMTEYLKYLEGRIDREAAYMAYNNPYNLKYLDLNFFITAEKIFDAAEAAVKPGSPESLHVQKERLIVDGALLFLWPWLERQLAPDAVMPFAHAKLICRYETNWRAQSMAFYSEKAQALREVMITRLAALFRDPQLPEQFKGRPARDVGDFNWLTFPVLWSWKYFAWDNEAAGGMAMLFAGDEENDHKKPLTFGVTGGATITLKPEEIPQDGKYHVFKIGRTNIKKGATVRATASGALSVNVDRVFVADAQDPKVNDWDVYVSLKAKGPAYVKGSTETNGVWMDRVLLVKPQKEAKAD